MRWLKRLVVVLILALVLAAGLLFSLQNGATAQVDLLVYQTTARPIAVWLLVCCALGYSRSAAAIAVWLVDTGRSADMAAAIERIRRLRPAIVLDAGRLEAALLTPAAARS